MTWTRRRFIKAGILAGTAFLFTDAFWLERFYIETKEFFLGTSDPDKTNIKVVQLSDLHIHSLNIQLKRLCEKINHISPDLILITGDAVDDPKKLYLLDQFLSLIDKNIQKVAILGNWEYWRKINLVDLTAIYAAYNCDLLINNNKQYSLRGKKVTVTGVDDFIAGKPDIEMALTNFKTSDYHIILNHCPQYNDDIKQKIPASIKTDLVLSGHTHGGQINLFGLVLYTPPGSGKYVKGWYKEDRLNIYVSKGIGTSLFPIRFMSRAEIAIFNLT